MDAGGAAPHGQVPKVWKYQQVLEWPLEPPVAGLVQDHSVGDPLLDDI